MIVIKRDGRKVAFNKDKIVDAINAAFKEVDGELTNKTTALSESIADYIELSNKDECLDVESIQNIIEDKLMASDRKDVARAYIIYRNDRTRLREKNSSLMKQVKVKLSAEDVQNQNANVDEHSFGGKMGEVNRLVMKQYALDNCMSEMAKNNHLNNEIYIHDLDSYAAGMHNCYDSSTRFVTRDGVKYFGDCADGQAVEVVDMNGEWRHATVRKYGKQKMYHLTFRSSQTVKTVTCTRNHRWVLHDGTVTDDIQVGDALWMTPEINNSYAMDDKLWCFGFVIGDGSDFYMKSKDRTRITNSSMQVRLCGAKTEFAPIFERCGWSVRQTFSDGDIVFISRGNGAYKQTFLDSEMWKMMSYNDLCNMFNGYIAADGHETNNGSIAISTADVRIKKMIEDISSVCGYYVWSQKEKYNDTNYKEGRTLYEMFLVKKQNVKWVLESITPERSRDKVAWCVEEPETHTFTLDGGMVTGNCLSLPFDKLLKNGFNTRQTDVRPANSINTAFQLVAVLFQLQSLQQFG